MPTILYVSSFFAGDGSGISRYAWHEETGQLEFQGMTPGTDALYLAGDRTGRFLYAANCQDECEGRAGAALMSYAVEPTSGDLGFINDRNVEGVIPVFLSLSPGGHFAIVANCGYPIFSAKDQRDGNASILALNSQGDIADVVQIIEHEGSSIDPREQECPHPHSCVFAPDGQFLYIPDRGTDQIMCYGFDSVTGRVSATKGASVDVSAGSGPRHMTFHPTLPVAYVISELQNTVHVYAQDAVSGTLELIETVRTLLGEDEGSFNGADVQVHPNGRFLYGSNRGHDCISCFEVDVQTGRLSLFDTASTGTGNAPDGHFETSFPRSFTISPTGSHLIVGNEGNNTIAPFRIDQKNGELVPAGNVVSSPRPGFLMFHELAD